MLIFLFCEVYTHKDSKQETIESEGQGMSKISRGLAIGLTALAIVSTSLFFLLKEPVHSLAGVTAPPATESAVKPETPAALGYTTPPAKPFDVAAALQDHVLGKDSAPVTIIEYASFTCPHCAHFATEILPQVKKRLLDTGKAKLIYRDFPLDQFALKAAMMSHCVSPIKYYNMVEVIFSNQDRWTKAKDPLESLAQLGSLAGMDADDFKSCTENKELETALLAQMQEAQTKYKVQSTPTFIFNDGAETLTGAQDADKFEAIVNKLTKGK